MKDNWRNLKDGAEISTDQGLRIVHKGVPVDWRYAEAVHRSACKANFQRCLPLCILTCDRIAPEILDYA